MASERKRARLEAIKKKNDLKGFLEEFRRESDRAAAILGAAYLDEEFLDLGMDRKRATDRCTKSLSGLHKLVMLRRTT